MNKMEQVAAKSKAPVASIELADGNKLQVKGDLDFSNVPALALQSQEYLNNNSGLDIDLAGVSRADSAGVALLVEWQRQSKKQNKPVSFFNVPPQMLAIARLCGVDELLSLEN